MKTRYFIIVILFLNLPLAAQVGIGNTDPKASLDISASNVATPSNTDGLLIPRMDEFPVTNPTADQDGMMVFVTGNGTPTKGFYYWNQGLGWTTVQGAGSDVDWLNTSGGTPTAITDDIYTFGKVGIGTTSISSNKVRIVDGDPSDINSLSVLRTLSTNDPAGFARGISAYMSITGSASSVYAGIYSELVGIIQSSSANFQASSPVTANNSIQQFKSNFSLTSGTGNLYGTHVNYLSNVTNTGNKYGYYVQIPNSLAGIHYGYYANIDSNSGYAAYFRGRTSLGIGSLNRYLMPEVDGATGQVMTTDGAGNVTFQNVTGDGTGTDDQQIDTFTFNTGTNTLTLEIEDDGQIAQTVDLSSLSNNDFDWLTNPGNSSATSNTDDIYTNGKVSIGSTDKSADFNISHSETADGVADVVQYNYVSNSGNDDKTIIENVFGGAMGGDNTAIHNELIGNGSGDYYGLYNRSYATVTGDIYGVGNSISATGDGIHYGLFNSLTGSGNGEKYGAYNYITGTGTGTKYGTYTNILTSAGGTHYGIYADVRKTNSYAGYFIGRTSLGTSTTNRYLMPTADGTISQVITTDGAGQLSFSTLTMGAERIDDLTDGKSDTDGTQDGSSIFFGINAGTLDNSTDNQNVGIGYNAMQANNVGQGNSALGYTTLYNNTSGNYNTAIGFSALYSNSSGVSNVGIGPNALVFNSTGDHNIAIGSGALLANMTGSNNIGIGETALFDHTIGENNIALGYRSLYNITTGNENVAIGAEAGLTNITGIGNVYLGNDAGRSHVGSNTLWIENTNADANNALIYGEFDNNILRTNGELQIGNPTGAGYAFPTTDGTASYVLRTNGAGQLSFIDPTTFPDGDTQNTLDQAYDEGGAGAGRTINATDGAVTIAGQDGFTVTGVINNGDFIAVTGAGTRMFFNPNKASFRAGTVNGIQWDNTNLGNNSVAFGSNNIASGGASSSLGTGNTSSGTASVTLGSGNVASGGHSVALNQNNTVSGLNSFAQGFGNTAAASSSAAMGLNNSAPSWGEMTVGANATTYTATGTTSWTGTDRVFTVGNGAGTTLRSNALTVYKNGEVNINDAYTLPTTDGTNGQVMTTDGSGNVIFQNAAVNTDNQNIENLSLNTTTNVLTVGIENGTSDTVDLSSLNPTKALARITMAADQAEAGGGITKVNFDTEDFDIGNNFNLTTDVFEAPTDGVYRVHAQITINPSTSTGTFDVRVRVDGSQVRRTIIDHTGSGSIVRQITTLLELTNGQTIDIAFQRATGVTVNSNAGFTYFEIEQL